ncbi:type IV pilin [Izhakiella australiensis]|uniref:Type IV pilin n=1 Tax=Izhakiella australiensis TaxID=1926881 RepID=A0A1S8YP46_9GAMM|nr:type 4 pilus major pilin [Izhakiella australiensis]OON40546.1 type IV pilin [Izhakiella australiensis]
MKTKYIRNKKGFSLLELLLVLGIIAALVVGAFIVYPKVQASQRAEAESKNIATIQSGVKALYNSASNYAGLNNAVGVQARIFPDNMLNGTGATASVVNLFKGNVTLAPSADSPSGTANSSFNITWVSVPAAECIKIVSAVAANFYIAEVGSAIVKSADGALDVASASQACNEGGNANIILLVSL